MRIHKISSVVVPMSEESNYEYLSKEVKKLQDRIKDQNRVLMVLTIIIFLIAAIELMANPNWLGFIVVMTLLVVLIALIGSSIEQHGL
jgi:high-affinity K+ transport system ATPase subunit B